MRYSADFETTTDPEDCRVWAWAACSLYDYKFKKGIDIESFFKWMETLEGDTLYFHNLKFDGEFMLCYMLSNGYTHCTDKILTEDKTFKTLISDTGQVYTFEILFNKKKRKKVRIYDSLKLLPMTVERVAKSFNLDCQKLEIDYKEKREKGHELTEQESKYIENDCLIVAKALNQFFEQGLTKMTIGSNALADYKSIVGKSKFEGNFPECLYDSFIRKSYRGGFTYLKPEYADKDIGEGIVLDVNSLYPSVMYANPYPVGEGKYFRGKYEPDKNYPLYVQSIRCQFEVKEGFLPTIQIKHSLSFMSTEYLTSSNGEETNLILTSIDLKLFLDHYNVYDMEYIDGWKFQQADGIFRDYIDKWSTNKIQAKKDGNHGLYTISKLFLNSLYGKFATRLEAVSKAPVLDEEGIVHYKLLEPETKKGVYIPVGVFVTSYARNVTIRSAQKVFDRFVYADTDSLHLIGTELPEGLEIDDTKLGAWKHESTFSRARFIRAKTYIEDEDGVLNVKACGLPDKCHAQVTWENFHPGAVYTGKLLPRHVPGGIVLEDKNFTISI